MINQNCVEIIPKKLFWISDSAPPKNLKNSYFFCIDNDLIYEPFFSDFGPLNLGLTHRFITEMDRLIIDQANSDAKIYHYTSTDTAKKANSAVLICCYAIAIQKMSADQIWSKFKDIKPFFVDYRDASYGNCFYKCKIIDVLRGFEYAISLNWYNIQTFNLKDYEYFERIQNGDINWIIPGRFYAFSGPQSTSRDSDGNRNFTPEDYLPIFKQMNIGAVVRLNNKVYDESRFTNNGIKHLDLYFTDGSVPSMEIVHKFLDYAEKNPNIGIAVHCKAGLGRTGTLIGAYAMKHYKFPGAAFIGWIRMCRPGSILGPQQFFLNDKQQELFDLGKDSQIFAQLKKKLDSELLDRFSKIELDPQEQSPIDKIKGERGDKNQAQRLNDAKKQFQNQ